VNKKRFTRREASQTKSCGAILEGYERVTGGVPTRVRCTRPTGHGSLHADQRDGSPIEWPQGPNDELYDVIDIVYAHSPKPFRRIAKPAPQEQWYYDFPEDMTVRMNFKTGEDLFGNAVLIHDENNDIAVVLGDDGPNMIQDDPIVAERRARIIAQAPEMLKVLRRVAECDRNPHMRHSLPLELVRQVRKVVAEALPQDFVESQGVRELLGPTGEDK
jgi:hypothetical protein